MPFKNVQNVLDAAIQKWTADGQVGGGGQPPTLSVHLTGPGTAFGWTTKTELLASSAFGLPLIQQNMIGKNPKLGSQTNLVMVLRSGVQLGKRIVRMPDGANPAPQPNQFITDEQIQVIEDWIDAGCPD